MAHKKLQVNNINKDSKNGKTLYANIGYKINEGKREKNSM